MWPEVSSIGVTAMVRENREIVILQRPSPGVESGPSGWDTPAGRRSCTY